MTFNWFKLCHTEKESKRSSETWILRTSTTSESIWNQAWLPMGWSGWVALFIITMHDLFSSFNRQGNRLRKEILRKQKCEETTGHRKLPVERGRYVRTHISSTLYHYFYCDNCKSISIKPCIHNYSFVFPSYATCGPFTILLSTSRQGRRRCGLDGDLVQFLQNDGKCLLKAVGAVV